MVLGKTNRLSKLAREFNVGISTIVDFLKKKGFEIDPNPNTKVSAEAVHLLEKEYKSDISLKKESEKIQLKTHRPRKESLSIDNEVSETTSEEDEPVIVSKVADNSGNLVEPKPEVKKEPEVKPKAPEVKPDTKAIDKIKIVGKINLETKKVKEEVKEEPPKPPKEDKKTEPKEKAQPKVKEKAKEPKPVTTEEKPLAKEASPDEKVKKEPPEEIKKLPSEKIQEEPPEEPGLEEMGTSEETEQKHIETDVPKVDDVKVVGKIDLSTINQKTRPAKKTKEQRDKDRKERQKQRFDQQKGKKGKNQEKRQDSKVVSIKPEKLGTPTVVGKINLKSEEAQSGEHSKSAASQNKRKRKRIKKDNLRVSVSNKPGQGDNKRRDIKKGTKRRPLKKEISEEDVQKQIKDTLARLTTKGGKSKGSKYRREKRAAASERIHAEAARKDEQKKVLKVTEFISVNELATMMDVPVTKIIATCMSLGLFVSINQRLDAETLSIVVEEFGFTVEFVSVEIQEAIEIEEDKEEDMVTRPPIVTVMGHVDHGKTSLLDFIRNTNVIAGEAGGITQHIGAYNVSLKDGRNITFLDTPGHEAFTAMRARGAQVTDIAIIIIAADDNVMPQTVEAINHAAAAGVPIVFAINKIDKPGANPERIKEELANMNYLVEEWGGKYQSQDISAKNGINIEELLEKVLLEAEMLDLKANPNKRAIGTIIESSLDKGRGFVSNILVESGTLRVGDVILSGQFYGHVKAMFNERNQPVDKVGPAGSAIILGLDGAPQAGDKFNVVESEREARNIANKREQLAREQGLRTQKHITLDEIGRRIAIGNFQELNLIVKGDVDGSIEALSDALIKLSTEEIQVNVIHKSVGAISETDIMLASASEAIVVGFQVRPTLNARKVAEREQIDIRLYSIIYDAINEIKAAMEGMLSPEIKEEITGTAEVLEIFKITKVGTIAGCIVRDGKISRNSNVRVIRDGIVIYTGLLGSLKRFKEDIKEVKNGYECGLNIENFNDIKVGDNIEAYKEVEVAKTL
ncbi:MAG: translation initiation factor IF-2 [Chlorobi bacterium]|nr:translation initiation factor IF-2 [Chlorobiota bacterium]